MTDKVFSDQMGNSVQFNEPIQSIVSLVPSQTELLFDLGVGHLVKGVTKFCVHPADKVRNVIKVGGTKRFRFDMIDNIAPDLIIGNKEENYKDGIDKLQEKYPVWMSDIYTLQDARDMIDQLSKLMSCQHRGRQLISNINHEFSALQKVTKKRVLYFIWNDPYMVASKNTFIDHMLTTLGLVNVAPEDRYPALNATQIKELNPDLILLSSEPFPFKAKHSEKLLSICPSSEIRIVNGEMFSWYGSRLKKAPAYFNSLDL